LHGKPALLIAVVLGALAVTCRLAFAHPLGNFTINHYAAIEAGPDGFDIGYVLDMAEIPTFQELGRMDGRGMERHLGDRLIEWARGVHVTAGDASVPLRLRTAHVSCLPGAGGLPTLRVEEQLSAAYPAQGPSIPRGGQIMALSYRDTNFPDRVGWKEIVVTGKAVRSSSVPFSDHGTNRLRSYPVDLLQSPPNDTGAQFSVIAAPRGGLSPVLGERPSIVLALNGCHASPDGSGGISDGQANGPPQFVGESTAFGVLFKQVLGGRLSVQMLAAVILGAFALGAYHAMTPGHGKAILAAYFVGSRGTPGQAVLLGSVVTLTHTTGVFVLGFATLLASRYVLPERLYPWLSILSGAMLTGVGGSLFWRRLKGLRSDHTHGHRHDHPHPHDHDGHDHDRRYDQGHAHHHLSPAEAVRPRDLITLGVTGGLLPCPAALVVMLGAISMGRVGLGLLLISAFSIGLAAVLTAGGLLMVYSRTFMVKIVAGATGARTGSRWVQAARPLLQRLPVFSAAAVAALGVAIVIQTVASIGTGR
jgi:nickel/cobalt exporter